ncbi:MAG: ABC transporter ATP-binding protein [Deltaproteobacteria bacterium]|nr:ABC transporter ATP-binding protein [Deltaproteobacteria bacterium]
MGSDSRNILETKELSKQFGGLWALMKVSLHVKEGEIVGLIGPNGAGKTTFINAITGLDPPTSGNIFFLGQNSTGLAPEIMCHKGLSRTFQISRLFPRMTVLESVMVSAVFGNRIHDSSSADVDFAREQLKFVEFPMPEDTISSNLNAVQLKRLDLARALASSPKLLFLDEIAAGLTGVELSELMGVIRRVQDKGITILMVEHIMSVIMNLCDRLIVLNFGNKIAEGPTKEVANDAKVVEAYLGGHV